MLAREKRANAEKQKGVEQEAKKKKEEQEIEKRYKKHMDYLESLPTHEKEALLKKIPLELIRF